MLLTVSKRLEFSASRRLYDPRLSAQENVARFGAESAARYGTGRNYVAYFVFSGTVTPETGMLMNLSEIKGRVGQVIDDGFDHKFLNEDNPTFAEMAPTAENVARQLFTETEPLFRDAAAQLVACHLQETETRSATVYASGLCEANYWFEFSAARQTMSPRLTSAENERLFGIAASPFGHGHNYRARVTLGADTPDCQIVEVLRSTRMALDHKNLNLEVAGMKDRPVTTESLAAYIFEKVASEVPIERIRLHERDDFFAEYWKDSKYFLGMRHAFHAAHRLHAPALSTEENAELFGRCNSPRGHGHGYLAEATIGGSLDARSGTLYPFTSLAEGMASGLEPWQDKHLDLETDEFRQTPSTGENIVQALWHRLNPRLDQGLTRLRLWETPNNRFTLRRG